MDDVAAVVTLYAADAFGRKVSFAQSSVASESDPTVWQWQKHVIQTYYSALVRKCKRETKLTHSQP